jgi:hypothetical protein
MRRLGQCFYFLTTLLIAIGAEAQYKDDYIPGFVGLESGPQAPPGPYLGNTVWVYSTNTVKDNAGNAINLAGSLTSTADITLVSVQPRFFVNDLIEPVLPEASRRTVPQIGFSTCISHRRCDFSSGSRGLLPSY